MKTGTKSLLFGVHQFLYHPLTVWLGWIRVYGRLPDFVTCLCIFFHDWGYWGCPDMDGTKGKRHPYWGANFIFKVVKRLNRWGLTRVTPDEAYERCLYHSSSLAKMDGKPVSALYLPDKVSILFEPAWFYLLRGHLSGELREFVDNSPEFVEKRGSWVWFCWYRNHIRKKLIKHNEDFKTHV